MRSWGEFCRADVAQCCSFHKYRSRDMYQALVPERQSSWEITWDSKKSVLHDLGSRRRFFSLIFRVENYKMSLSCYLHFSCLMPVYH